MSELVGDLMVEVVSAFWCPCGKGQLLFLDPHDDHLQDSYRRMRCPSCLTMYSVKQPVTLARRIVASNAAPV